MKDLLFSDLFLPIVIGLIMFNLGLSLRFDDFKNVLTEPRVILLGLMDQMILLPIIAFGLAFMSDVSDMMKVGIIIIAACPGGATSNLITYHLKGDVPLSISLTSINSILILVTIPFIVFMGLHTFTGGATVLELPIGSTIAKIFYMILIPTFIGIVIRKYFRTLAINVEKYMKYITTALLAIVFVIVYLENRDGEGVTIQQYFTIGPYVLILNLLGMLAGYLTARLAGYGRYRQLTFAVEVGIQNSALAITIASSSVFLGSPQMAIPAVMYGLITFFNAVLFGLIIKKSRHMKIIFKQLLNRLK